MKSLITALIIILFCFPICSPGKKTETTKINWEAQSSGTNASFRGLSVISETIAWASGSSGTFTRTIDGGKTWQTDTIPGVTSLDFRDIQAFDENTAIVISAGRPAKIFKTIDGGKNWDEKYSNVPGFHYSNIPLFQFDQNVASQTNMES
jgi:photosystem II stability/assembly factor-like uncharacterized protein